MNVFDLLKKSEVVRTNPHFTLISSYTFRDGQKMMLIKRVETTYAIHAVADCGTVVEIFRTVTAESASAAWERRKRAQRSVVKQIREAMEKLT